MFRFRSVRELPGRFHESIKRLIQKYPRTFLALYLGFVTVFALAGYAFILLFPALFIAGTLNIYHGVTSSDSVEWINVSAWLLVSAISGLICYRYIQYKPSPPGGLNLAEDKAPELFKLVEQIRAHFKRPAIHRIVITPDYEIDILKTPAWALPLWSQNTLVIGLPVLQCLSPYQFECMLTRCLGQFSKRDNLLLNWLYQMRSVWKQYHASLAKHCGYGVEPLKWFFSVYAPLYSILSVGAARRDQLKADFYAMDLYNDEEVRDMITTDAVCRYYLESRYWPAVNKIAALATKTITRPHQKMTAAVQANLTGEKLSELVKETLAAEPESSNRIPALRERIRNIGHDQARMEGLGGTTAAVCYLGASMIGIIALVDKLWLKQLLDDRSKQKRQGAEQAVSTQATSA